MSQIADQAAFLAQEWRVFPVMLTLEDGEWRKQPLCRWRDEASRDPAIVRRLFAHPAANGIGVPMGAETGLFLVDLDTKKGAPGLEWLAANQHRLPPTRTHETPSGGLHLYFRWPHGRNIRNSASRVAPGVDVRGEGGFSMMPPSPHYSVKDPAMPAEAPAWLLDAIDPPAAPQAAPQPYKPPSADRSARYAEVALDRECQAVAGAGEGGRNHQLNVSAVKLGSLVAAGALSESTVRAELRRAALHAGLEPRETDATIQSGLSYGMTQPRQIPERQHVVPHDSRRRDPQAPPPLTGETQQHDNPTQLTDGPKPFPTLTLDEIEALPPPVWLIEGLLVENSNASLIAPPKSLKSFLALDWALHIAYGIKWHGRAVKQGGVLYIAGEGVGGMQRRVAAWRAFHGCAGNTAPFRLVAVPFRIMDKGHIASAIATAAAMMEADGFKPLLYVNDTLARSMAGADENSAQDMGRAVEGMDEIKAGTGSTMLSVHHTGKDADRGARGSSALLGAVDTEITVKRSESLLTIKVTAQKDAEEGDEIVVRAQKVGLDGRDPVEGKPSSLVLRPSDLPPPTPGPSLSDGSKFALDKLREVVIREGVLSRPGSVPEAVPPGVKWVSRRAWRAQFDACSALEGDDTKRRTFNRAVNDLTGKGVIAAYEDFVWVCNDK